jgi:hypothetical protein
MAAVRLVVNFRVKPGRYPDLFEGIKAVKKAVGQLGGSLVVNRQVIGPETGHIFVVTVYADYAAFAKSRTDPDLTRAVDAIRNNTDPAHDAITVSLNEEVAI